MSDDIDDRLSWDEGDFEITKEGPTLTEGDLYVPAGANWGTAISNGVLKADGDAVVN